MASDLSSGGRVQYQEFIYQDEISQMEQNIDYELSLALEKPEPDYDVVACDCGHDELTGEVCPTVGMTMCRSCYEKAKSDWESTRRTDDTN